MSTTHALIVDPPSPRREELGGTLAAIGCRHSYATTDEAPEAVQRRHPEIVIVSARTADASGEIECLRRMGQAACHPRLIFVAEEGSEALAVAAFRSGAHHYLRAPWTVPMLHAAVLDLVPGCVPADMVTPPLVGGEKLVGRSPAMRELRAYLARIAPTMSNVIVLGETGTGKEVVAELIHTNSRRASGPFVCLNTAAIPEALLENELFGHERGAYTGATAVQSGKLAAAHGGTVFLDEIGEVSPAIQAKLLRAIESKAVYRLGGTRRTEVDFRIVAATNTDLEAAVRAGTFRKDLYYRLNVVRVDLPPLRERPEDVPLLIEHYLRHFNRELGRSVGGLSERAIAMLRDYQWPGNIRELKNVVEALLVNLAPETTGEVDVPPQVMRQLALALSAPTSERERLLDALVSTNWNKSRAAEKMRCSRMTLYRKLQHYGLGPGFDGSTSTGGSSSSRA
jgi:DNA-binding NtrC family response regulator